MTEHIIHNNSNIWKKTAVLLAFVFLCALPETVPAAQHIGVWNVADTEEIKPSELYARSAVLMDGESGRVLFSKNGREEMPMASTTKVMTCILALEQGNLSDQVSVSSEAAAQPEVKLGMRSGQTFLLKDLLYSLMLESHNDTAVAIAEHVGGSVQGFADRMNEKAELLGCSSTYFITPNGLDAQDENGIHHTTAEDLARILRYCIMESEKKEEFLEITGTSSNSFADCSGSSSYSCTNHNTFLTMMEGALTGKTGFTADAGYCYTGALRRDDRTFIVALLACGWPNNKGYKWSDTGKLMNYALENYEYREMTPQSLGLEEEITVSVRNGYRSGYPQMDPVPVKVCAEGASKKVLLKTSEEVQPEYQLPDVTDAPVQAGERLGEVVCSVNGEAVAAYTLYAAESVTERGFDVCAEYVAELFFMRNSSG